MTRTSHRYSYDYAPDTGHSRCPVCHGRISWKIETLREQSDWLECEECGLECNARTGEVWGVDDTQITEGR